MTTKWVTKPQLLHPNNTMLGQPISIKHNREKYVQQNTLAAYESCINFTQAIDKSFVHPHRDPYPRRLHQRM